MAKEIRWDETKNQLLLIQRGFCFEDVLELLEQGRVLGIMQHPNVEKYPNQRIFVLGLNGYVCYVPFVETDIEIFLKTIIPSRKLHKKYTGGSHER
ncbi:MAG: BrnT family toxin [Gammaproteobacteria bacterium]|nr:BrnT family toxin [Gammaproteobacteria bacterium]